MFEIAVSNTFYKLKLLLVRLLLAEGFDDGPEHHEPVDGLGTLGAGVAHDFAGNAIGSQDGKYASDAPEHFCYSLESRGDKIGIIAHLSLLLVSLFAQLRTILINLFLRANGAELVVIHRRPPFSRYWSPPLRLPGR